MSCHSLTNNLSSASNMHREQFKPNLFPALPVDLSFAGYQELCNVHLALAGCLHECCPTLCTHAKTTMITKHCLLDKALSATQIKFLAKDLF